LQFLSLPASHWEEYTLEFASLPQLAKALCAAETLDFLCARIEEICHWHGQLLQLLHALPYTLFMADESEAEPLADEELTASLMQFAWHHPLFTPEFLHLFLRLLAHDQSRHRLGDIVSSHARRELPRITQAGRLRRNGLFGYANSLSPLAEILDQFEENGLLVQESQPPVVRLRFLPSQPLPKQPGKSP
jgi:hypothetical protein